MFASVAGTEMSFVQLLGCPQASGNQHVNRNFIKMGIECGNNTTKFVIAIDKEIQKTLKWHKRARQ
jgi:uncharacterized protein (UPF0333 family)